jgi:hypothetical protein
MPDRLNRHDAYALDLIDQALSQGFSPELVAQISEAFAHAEREESARSCPARR